MTEGALWRRLRTRVDWPLTLLILGIAAIGLTNLFSATHDAPVHGLFRQQIMWMIVGGGLYVVTMMLDYRIWLRLSWMALGAGLLAIVGVHFFGVVVKGSRRWLGWGSYGIQPSEFIKLAVAMALARFIHDAASETTTWVTYTLRILAFGATILLIAWQPDLGTAALVALICISVALLLARRLWPILVAMGTLALAAVPLWAYVLKPYQRKRLLIFWDPTADPSGAGWHARQSIFAVGSGRIVGKGFLHGTQNQLNFLPEHWTDFPFSVWAEEWGFLGSLGLLALYFMLLLWTLHVASQARDRYGATLCVAVGAMLFWHIIVNIAMVTGLAPVVGVTLPLVSYGGSSVLTTFIGLGLVGSVSIRRYSR